MKKKGNSVNMAAKISDNSVSNFFGDVKQELKRISWTKPDELKSYTKVVLAMVFIFGLSIYFMDLAASTILSKVGLIFRFLIG